MEHSAPGTRPWPTPSRDEMWHNARSLTSVFAVDVDGVRYFVSTADAEIGYKLFVNGSFELDVLERAVALLPTLGTYGLSDRTFVDIGANVGSASLLACCKFGARAGVAFEPEPSNSTLLRINLVANGLEDRVRTFNCALSDAQGYGWLEINPDNSGNHLLYGEYRDRRVRVPMNTFDSYVESGNIELSDVGLVWIDVEGAELRVLSGAKRLLEVDVPVVMEYWPDARATHDEDELLLAMLQESYSTFADLRDPAAAPRSTNLLRNLRPDVLARGCTLTDILLTKS